MLFRSGDEHCRCEDGERAHFQQAVVMGHMAKPGDERIQMADRLWAEAVQPQSVDVWKAQDRAPVFLLLVVILILFLLDG